MIKKYVTQIKKILNSHMKSFNKANDNLKYKYKKLKIKKKSKSRKTLK
jgi:hypothetical protein